MVGWQAIDGDTLGLGEQKCMHTLREQHAWWEVDLGRRATIAWIKVHNRQDVEVKGAYDPPDLYSAKLFPFHIMVSVVPFDNYKGTCTGPGA